MLVNLLNGLADRLQNSLDTNPVIPAAIRQEAQDVIREARSVSGMNLASIAALLQLILQVIQAIEALFPAAK